VPLQFDFTKKTKSGPASAYEYDLPEPTETNVQFPVGLLAFDGEPHHGLPLLSSNQALGQGDLAAVIFKMPVVKEA